jgi:hypothetical protein
LIIWLFCCRHMVSDMTKRKSSRKDAHRSRPGTIVDAQAQSRLSDGDKGAKSKRRIKQWETDRIG